MRKIMAFILAVLVMFSITAPVLACDPTPEKPSPKYINCDDLGSGYRYGFGFAGARNGTYRLVSGDGVLIGGAPQDPRNSITVSGSSGRVFNWQSTLGIDAVIIHAGGSSTVRRLNEAVSGEGFSGKLGRDRKPYKIDGVSFCYDYELGVSTSARGTVTGGGGEWAITKTVDQPIQERFAGETAPFQYTVAVNGTAGSASGFEVVSEVVVQNNTPIKATLTAVKNYLPGYKKWTRLDCGSIRFPYKLAPWSELKCSAVTPVGAQRGGESVAGVTARGFNDVSASAEIAWSGGGSGGAPAGPATVTDTNPAFGGPYTVSASSTWTYTVDLTCPSDPALYTDGLYTLTLDNTAAIQGTDKKASQSVTLQCYAPVVSGEGASTYDAAYQWGITKTSPISSLTLERTDSASVDYDVAVSVTGQVERNFRSTGAITVRNPHPSADMQVNLFEAGSQNFPAAIKGCANPLAVPAGQSVTCAYEALAETAPAQGGLVQVWMNDAVYGSLNPADFRKTAGEELDECVTVYDSAFTEPLGTACADQSTGVYEYAVTVGPFDSCVDTDYTNTAYFYTNDTKASDFANWQVLIDVKCTVYDCTYTAAYWIAHANATPGLYDTTWDKVGGPDAAFFETGQTWLAVLSGEGLDVYDELAREYIVARLNVLRGAKPYDGFLATLDHAAALLAEYAANPGGVTDAAVVNDFKATRQTILDFNTGFTGPGLCPDC